MQDSAKKGFHVSISGSIPSYLRRMTPAIFRIFDFKSPIDFCPQIGFTCTFYFIQPCSHG